MQKVRIEKKNRSRKFITRLSKLLKNRLFLISTTLMLVGAVVFVVAETIPYTYNYPFVQKNDVSLSSGQIVNLSFATFQDLPTNITFLYTGNQSVLNYHIYEVYTTHTVVLRYTYNSLLVASGEVNTDKTIVMNATSAVNYYSTDETFYQKYYMLANLAPGENATNVQVNIEITIPEHEVGDPVVGYLGWGIILSGVALMAVFVTKEARRRERYGDA